MRLLVKAPGYRSFQGLPIHVEHDRGDTRRGTSPDGTKWATTMLHPYGEVLGTVAIDGDPIDVFIGPNPHATHAYVVQSKLPGTSRLDECKVMLGWDTQEAAVSAFRQNFDRPGFFLDVTKWPMPAFIDMVRSRPDLQRGRLDAAALAKMRKARALPVGTITTYVDGTRHQKRADGSWPQVIGDPHPHHADDPAHWRHELRAYENDIRHEPDEHARVRLGDGSWHETGPEYTNAWLARNPGHTGRSSRNICAVAPELLDAMKRDGHAVFTHNHPSGGPPSAEDVQLAIALNLAELRAASPRGGAWVIRRPTTGWPPLSAFATDWANTGKHDTTSNARHRMDRIVDAAGGSPSDGQQAKGFDPLVWQAICGEEGATAIAATLHRLGVRVEYEEASGGSLPVGRAPTGLLDRERLAAVERHAAGVIVDRLVARGVDPPASLLVQAGRPLTKARDRLHGGKADDVDPGTLDPEALAEGAKHEREHTDDPQIAREIAADHIVEDPDYYEKLKRIEKSVAGLAAVIAVLEKARGVKLKPGERVTRKDGSVWEGRAGGPPVRLPKHEADAHKAIDPQRNAFARDVLAAARAIGSTPPFDHRVAIAQVYDEMQRRGWNLPIDRFKELLVEEAKRRHLVLERLDLPDGDTPIPPGLRDRSHTPWGSDFVHFVAHHPVRAPEKRSPHVEARRPTLVDAVLREASAVNTGPSPTRVPISHLYDHMMAKGYDLGTLDEFKAFLLKAAKERRIELSPWDLGVGEQMDADTWHRSHTPWGSDFVHFVVKKPAASRTAAPPPMSSHIDAKRALARELVNAHGRIQHPEAREQMERAMRSLGLQQIHARGEAVTFDGARHVSDHDLFPGDAAEVEHPGWKLEDEAGPLLLKKAQVRPRGAS